MCSVCVCVCVCVSLTEHEGPVCHVCISDDGLKVLASTSTGSVGYLDVASRGYSTVMRSHTHTVLGFSIDGIRRRITTASRDGTVRVWDMDSMQQVSEEHTTHTHTPTHITLKCPCVRQSILERFNTSDKTQVYSPPLKPYTHRGVPFPYTE